MKINNSLKIVFVITVLSLITYSGFTEYNKNTMVEDELIEKSGEGFGQSMGVILIIENERNGEIIHKMVKEKDLAVRSLAGLIHYMIKGGDIETSYIYDLTTGANKKVYMTGTYYVAKGLGGIRIGTGTTAPTYEDYKLETEISYDKIEAIGYNVNDIQMNATYVTTFNIDDTYAITECAFSSYDFSTSSCYFIVFRDVFSAINVESGDLLTVKYVVMFN